MKKRLFLALLLLISILSILVLSQEESEDEILEEVTITEEAAGINPDSPLYVLDTFVDDINIALRKGSSKSEYARKVKNERIAEAEAMVNSNNAGSAVAALNKAAEAAGVVESTGFSPKHFNSSEDDTKKSIERLEALKAKLPAGGLEGVEKAIDAQISQEEKIRTAKGFIKTIGDYCEQLSYEDFELMEQDPTCDEDSEDAPEWLKEYIDEDLRAREENAKKFMIEQVTTCVLSPRDCDCSKVPVKKHRAECESNKELAIKCEYDGDFEACNELSKKDIEGEDIPDFLKPVFKQTLKDVLEKKEKQMFAKFRPPECEHVETPKECFTVMKELYGMPPECDGLSDDECFEKMKEMGPGERPDFPPECKEAGANNPRDCVKIMIEKYGTPEWCEGLSLDDCVKESMKHRGGPSQDMKMEMPEECKEAGATSPKECFNVMTDKHGTPPECEGISREECFRMQMERGPGEGQREMPNLPPECEGLSAKECFEVMKEKHMPEECKGLSSREECEALMRSNLGGRDSAPPECEGLNREECFEVMKEKHMPEGMPDDTSRDFMPDSGRGFKGENIQDARNFMPEGCEGLSMEECKEKMMQEAMPEGRGIPSSIPSTDSYHPPDFTQPENTVTGRAVIEADNGIKNFLKNLYGLS